ncbi:hypothetical protein BH23ACI1_BH23ACI1_06600 [soil metagenome]
MRRLTWVLSAAVVGAATVALPASDAQAQVQPRTPEAQSASLGRVSLSGTVIDERGEAVRGAMVTVAGQTTAMAVTDEQGRFWIGKLPSGEYLLRAHLSGFSASARTLVEVGGGVTQHQLQMRRLDGAVGTSGAPAGTLPSRPIIAAGFELPAAETADVAVPDSEGADHPHSELAWRLRHIKRSILKDTTPVSTVAESDDAPAGSIFGRAASSGNSLASGLFLDLPLTGEVNLLTTGSYGSDLWDGDKLPRGVAYFSLGAPTPAGDWLVRGAMTQGDLESWVVAGSFTSRREAMHTYEVGLAYSTQEYLGGNPAALTAVKDGNRNVGEIRVTDRWAFTSAVVLEYGGRFAHHGYLDRRGLVSPRMALSLEPRRGTRFTGTVAQRMVAPGAEEFLTSTASGPWLPPERTFAPLTTSDPLRAERARSVDLLFEHDFDGAYVLGVRRFFQDVSDQLVTMFGLSIPQGARSVGHYYVASAGGLDADGWGVRLSSPPERRVRASVDYTWTRARWTNRGDLEALWSWAPAVIRPTSEQIHDLTTSVETEIPETATRFFVIYKVNSAFTRAQAATGQVGTDGRFDLQVHQALPFDVAGTRWEVLVGVRNLFRDVNDPASVYDELLVVRPPTRVMGGFLVRF